MACKNVLLALSTVTENILVTTLFPTPAQKKFKPHTRTEEFVYGIFILCSCTLSRNKSQKWRSIGDFISFSSHLALKTLSVLSCYKSCYQALAVTVWWYPGLNPKPPVSSTLGVLGSMCDRRVPELCCWIPRKHQLTGLSCLVLGSHSLSSRRNIYKHGSCEYSWDNQHHKLEAGLFCGGSKKLLKSTSVTLSLLSQPLWSFRAISLSVGYSCPFWLGLCQSRPSIQAKSYPTASSSQEFMDSSHVSHKMTHSSKAYWKTVPLWQPHT